MAKLKVGDPAPKFVGIVQEGKTVTLEEFKGRKVILFFYPKDMTPGCTNQVCNLRDNYKILQDKGFVILGVSPDDSNRHDKFIAKHDLPFPLIADPDKNIIESYGVWGPKKFMGKEYDGLIRTTFVIDETGHIEAIIPKVKTKDHANQILDILDKN